MITNIQTSLTYSTLTLALAALPSIFDRDYELVLANGTYDTAGVTTTISKNTNKFSLIIRGQSKEGVLLSSTTTTLTLSGNDTRNVTLKDFRISGGSTQTISIQNPSFITVENVDMISTLGNFFRITGPTTSDIMIKNCSASTEGHCVLLMSNPSNLSFISNNFKVNRVAVGTFRCIANGTNISGFLNVIGNTFEVVNGAEGVNLTLSTTATNINVERNIFKSCTNTQFRLNSDLSRDANILFRNNLFNSSVTFSVYVDYGNITFYNNTVIKNTSLLAAVRFNFISNFVGIKNNIFYSTNTKTESSSSWISITFLDASKSVSNVNSDYNLFYAPLISREQSTPGGTILIWEPTSKLMSIGSTTYNTLTTIQAANSDLHSKNSDPLFTMGVNDTPYYYLTEESPAYNSADFNVTMNTTDIRGFYRQDRFTDMGAYDIDAGQFSKPPSDEVLYQGVIRRNDGATFPNIQLAISATYSKDETVYLDVTSDTSSNWITMPGITTKNKVIIQPHHSVIGKVVVRDTINMNLATSISSCRNVIFKNIIFDAYRSDGVTPGLCGLSVGLGISYNLFFEGCEFRNGQHAVYLYTGQDIVFKNCKFYNFYNYAIYGANVKSVHLIGCEFDYGDFAGKENLVESFERNLVTFKSCENIIIKNCKFKGSVYTEHNLRIDDVIGAVIENNIFEGAGRKRPLLIGGTSGKFATNIKINNNVFKNNGNHLPVGDVFSLVSLVSVIDVEFKNNSIFDNSERYTNMLYARSDSKNFTICNNFVLAPNPVNLVTCFRLSLDKSAAPDDLVISNNYYATNTESYILSVDGQGRSNIRGVDVNSLNTHGFELGSIKNTNDFNLSSYLLNDLPFSGSLISSGGDFILSNSRDINGMVKNNTVSFGAAYFDSLDYTPNLDYSILMYNTFDREYLPNSLPYNILANDTNLLKIDNIEVEDFYEVSIEKSMPSLFVSNVIDINTIDSESPSSFRVAVFDGDIDFNNVYSFTDILTSIKYNIDYSYYDNIFNKTYVVCFEPVPLNINITYKRIEFLGIGYSGLLKFDNRDEIYTLRLTKISNNVSTNVFVVDNFISTLQARCKSNFMVEQNILYIGDTTKVTNISIEADESFFTITGGGLNIDNDNRDVIEFTPTSIEDVQISLYSNNSSNIPNIKIADAVVKVLPIPHIPVLNFDTNKQILHKDEILKLCGTNDINNNNKITRFIGSNPVKFNWSILHSNTNTLFMEFIGANVDIPLTDFPVGSYDIQLTLSFDNNPDICKDLLEKRYLTVLPSFTGSVKKHFITCSVNDIGAGISGFNMESSIIFGDRTVNCLNTEIINPGDVIVLDGSANNVRLFNLHGTKENPILIIANGDNGIPFNVKTNTYHGILMEYCTNVILSGFRNYSGTNLPHSIVVETNTDPKVYNRAPGTMQISLVKFVSDVRICGVECKYSKFDCISAKMSPDANDPSTWRNDKTGGWCLDNLNIHHNLLRDSQGEGVYLGHFATEMVGNGTNSDGVWGPYYAHILTNTKVFRNDFINNGFDAIQLSNCFSGAEIHNNILINSGFRQVFGQSSGIAANYIVGDIYNNYIGDGIVSFCTQGIQRIFNNIIDNGSVVNPADTIYILSRDVVGLGKWDISQKPPVLVDPLYNGYNTEFIIFNNILRTGRKAFILNPEYGFAPSIINLVNNVIITPDNLYKSDFRVDNPNWWMTIININNKLPSYTLRNINNIIYKESELGLMRVSDPDQGLFKITNNSPLYQTGVDLKDVLRDDVYRDKNGYLLPSFDNKYPVGPYDFETINTYNKILIMYHFFNNNIQTSRLHNSIWFGSASNNTIKDGLKDCTFGDNFNENTIGLNFKNNLIGDNFTNNIVEDNFNKNNGANFKNSSLVYQPFNKKLFITSDGLQKLRYFTNDGLIIKNMLS